MADDDNEETNVDDAGGEDGEEEGRQEGNQTESLGQTPRAEAQHLRDGDFDAHSVYRAGRQEPFGRRQKHS